MRTIVPASVVALASMLVLHGSVHAQSCGPGGLLTVTTVSNQAGPMDPPWNGLPLDLPQFHAVAGQALLRADITASATMTGEVQGENLSTTGPCNWNWCLQTTLDVDVPVPMQPPLDFPLSFCGLDHLGAFDGTVDFRGVSGVTHSIGPTTQQATISITDTGVLASVFTGPGNVTFHHSALNNTMQQGCGNFTAIFANHDAVSITIAYSYCSPGADFCIPGRSNVASCPCNNPQLPAGSAKGCNNSASTGGAVLHSGGAASLAADSLVFTSTGETPNATTIFLQGNATIPSGVVFGQGIRCSGGQLERLYVAFASSGVASAPTGSDPSVSARSAALGDTIAAGTSRFYSAYYRDGVVLGGCPSTSTFNTTQGQSVTWAP